MEFRVGVIGGGLAGSEAALQLASHGIQTTLIEARPVQPTPVHKTDLLAELVCSNSLKSEKPNSAAGMLKEELATLHSFLYSYALQARVPAGGALAVDREQFAALVTNSITNASTIQLIRAEARSIQSDGTIVLAEGTSIGPFDALVVATGPLTCDSFAGWLGKVTGLDSLSFYDAAAPIVLRDSLDLNKVFAQSRYEEGAGDYLNAPFTKEEYEAFIDALLSADKVIKKDFESKDLFQACQPIEEIARAGRDAPRFGPLKPVGLVDPETGKRPWAAVQLRAEDIHGQSYNLVGFQTNLTFPEQKRVFSTIPGLEHAEFVRYGVMHRNTFLDAPRVMLPNQQLRISSDKCACPVYLAGQISGTEGYCEAIRSGLQAAIEIMALFKNVSLSPVPPETVYGALLAYATSSEATAYQPMHVNFGIIKPLNKHIRNKTERYDAYANRASRELSLYTETLQSYGLLA